MSDYLPWIEKYRPLNFNKIISNEQNLTILKNMIIGGSLPHLLFHGTSGTGAAAGVGIWTGLTCRGTPSGTRVAARVRAVYMP